MYSNFKQYILLPVLALYLGLACGCRFGEDVDTVSEVEEKHYLRAQRLLKEGRNNEALAAFLKVVEKRSEAPESHLEVGQLYLRHLGDPVTSIYHFRKYLEYRSDSEQSSLVRQLIETAQKEFARKLPGRLYAQEVDRLDMLDLVEQLRDENLQLKRELSAVKSGTLRLAKTETVEKRFQYGPQVVEELPQPKTYIVEGGDTLSRISTKVYGNPGRWKEIFEANRGLLNSPHDLRSGQELEIP
tara:strand:+ start:81013 stop:81741 length:729 start_codon:yes stop_codon:yes gene_type:complete